MRRRLAWLVALPAMLTGSQLAHALAYRLAYPEAHVRLLRMAATGHGYVAWLPLALGVAGSIAVVALVAAGLDAARGRPIRDVPAFAFALLPPLAFVLQEFLELSLHLGRPSWQFAAAPTFLPGLLLQLPFAVLAYVAARLLLRAAELVGRALARRRRPRPAATFSTRDIALTAGLQPSLSLARAPPVAAVV
jgi:hypothetical protein